MVVRDICGQEPITTPKPPNTTPLRPIMKLLNVPMAPAGIPNSEGKADPLDEKNGIPESISGTMNIAAIIERLSET